MSNFRVAGMGGYLAVLEAVDVPLQVLHRVQ